MYVFRVEWGKSVSFIPANVERLFFYIIIFILFSFWNVKQNRKWIKKILQFAVLFVCGLVTYALTHARIHTSIYIAQTHRLLTSVTNCQRKCIYWWLCLPTKHMNVCFFQLYQKLINIAIKAVDKWNCERCALHLY